jgi:hypothetical protein
MPKYRLPLVTRRDLLALIAASGATSTFSSLGCHGSTSSSPSSSAGAGYFTPEERSILGALADAVIPPDDAPGASALGAVDYIETLLTAFEQSTPPIFGGGPYSGRTPLPNDQGGASGTSPPDDFSNFLQLDRVAQRAWMLRIYGSSGVPGGGPNDAIVGPVVGLRDAVASAISQAQQSLPPNVAPGALTADEGAALLASIDKATQATLIELVLEGAFTAPEYGGNANAAGWAMVYFEGDSQPYGYSTYDTTTGMYVEHPQSPCSTANPGPDPMPMDANTEQMVSTAFLFLGGTVFS